MSKLFSYALKISAWRKIIANWCFFYDRLNTVGMHEQFGVLESATNTDGSSL